MKRVSPCGLQLRWCRTAHPERKPVASCGLAPRQSWTRRGREGAAPARGCRTARGTVGVRQPWALLGVLQSGGPSATFQHPEFLQVFLKECI